MHWESHKLALPKLSRGEEWIKLSDTAFPAAYWEMKADILKEEHPIVTVNSRSIAVFMTQKREGSVPRKKGKKTSESKDSI